MLMIWIYIEFDDGLPSKVMVLIWFVRTWREPAFVDYLVRENTWSNEMI